MNERDLFMAALQIEGAAERSAHLDRACAGQTALRQRVEALLAAFVQAGSFLQQPAGDLGATSDVSHPGPSSGSDPAEGPGTVIGPYKLINQIGEGGMGTVWMAQQTESVKRLVAIKLIKAGMDSRQVIARFEAERQALALMDHPNIARVLDGGTTGAGRPYFVMDLVRGVQITRGCDEHRLTPRQRLELFLPVCQAVQHAHQKGIIHRDLKPSNVLVAPYDGMPVPKVIDFGVAKATGQPLTDETLVTGLGALVGTLEYMSPEQAEINQLDIDTRSDIYSLGVLLYELLTGSPPFTRQELGKGGMLEMLRVIREQEPTRPSTKLSTAQGLPTLAANRGTEPAKLTRLVRGELDWIVMKALEKDRARRYETASALAADVQRYLRDEPVLAGPPSAVYRVRKFVRRNKAALGIAGLTLCLIGLLGGGGGWVARDRAARDQEAAHDRQVRKAALDRDVEHALDEAWALTQQGRWPEALAAAERADNLLASAGRSERPPRLLGLQKELNFARRLEDIGQGPRPDLDGLGGGPRGTRLLEGFFSGREQDARFARAFQEFGIDIDALGPEESAALIRGTGIRQALVNTLDEWAGMRRRARPDDDPGWRKLVEVAQQADADVWRNRFRDAFLRRDRPGLEKLADAVPLRDVPPATLHLLGSALMELGASEKAMSVLRQGRRQYPDDLWLNYTLARFSWTEFRPRRYEDALRYYTAVSALRPRLPEMHRAMALVLSDRWLTAGGALDEAIAEYSRVIEMTPEDVMAWTERGRAYHHWLHQYGNAIADFSRAVELNPENPGAHSNLAGALQANGQLDEAITQYREAVRLHETNPESRGPLRDKDGVINEAAAECASAHSDLGDTLLAFAELCQLPSRRQYALAARCFGEAFEEEPALAEDLGASRRSNAARAAALAGCGQGQDAAGLDEQERARLRRQALAWLRADLEARGRLLEREGERAGPGTAGILQHWLVDPGFAGVRGPKALADLPEAERQPWQQLWAHVTDTLARAREKTTPEQKSDMK
jgi:serine/threonine protein kinase